MSDALKGLKVLDLSTGPAAGIATMILADFGAEVLHIRSTKDDPLQELPSAPMWMRGKHCINLDVNQSRNEFEDLCRAADVLVCSWRPAKLTASGLDFDSLHKRHPHLTLCHITGFGAEGKRANYPGYEHVAAAVTGRMLTFSGIVDRKGPVFSALQVGTHACAQSAVTGILAAELTKQGSGEGRLVETSMLQGMLPYEQGAAVGYQFPERFGRLYVRGPSPDAPVPSLYYHPLQAADGRWMQFGNLLPHLFDNFLMVTDLIDVIADPDWVPGQLLLKGDKQEPFRERMMLRIQEKTSDEWMAACIDNGGVVATKYQTTQEALSDPDIVANGHVVAREDGGVQLGPVARMTKTPAKPGADAVAGDLLKQSWLAAPARTETQASQKALPLKGIKVVELATIIAAPQGASFLADLGADVVKVEQIGGDPYRGLGLGVGSSRVNAGKRSISLNLKSEEGQKIAKALMADADVVIHNYRPGVPERLGIGYDDLAAVNPSVVYLQVNGYGPDGPGAQRPSTHPIPGAAMGGVLYQMGGRVPEALQDVDGHRLWSRWMMRANEVNPDPNTAMVVGTSALLGLSARQRTGQGQRILIDMFGANAYANHDDFLNYPGKPPRAALDKEGYGLSPTYRLYPSADEQWLFLALLTDGERSSFYSLVADAGFEVPTVEELRQNDDSLAERLTELFLRQSAEQWEALLASQGIGCVRADRQSFGDFWLDDEEVLNQELTQVVQHPVWGDYRRHGANVNIDGKQPALKPPPLAGQHAQELLLPLGYSAEEVESLLSTGVLFQASE